MRKLKQRAVALILAAGMVFASTPAAFLAQEAAEEAVTEKQTEAVTEKPTEKVTEKQTEKVTEQPTEKVTEKVTEKPTEKVTEKVTEKPTEKPTEKVTEQPTEKVTEKVTEKPTEKVTEKVTEKATEKLTEKVTEKVTEKATEKVTEKQTEKATEKKTEKPAKKTAETETETETETEAEPKTKFEYKGNGVTLRAKASEKAKLPQDASIHADQIAPGSAGYASALTKLQAVYGEQIDGVTIYDIYFTDKDKEKIQPEKGSVKITLEFANPAERTLEGEIGGAFVAHINNSGSVDKLGGSVNVNSETGRLTSATFTTDSFSPFAAGVIVKPAEETESETEEAQTESETEAVQTESETEAAQTESETEAAQTESETEAAQTESETQEVQTETESESESDTIETESETDEKPVGVSERLLALGNAVEEMLLAGENEGSEGFSLQIRKEDEESSVLTGAELQLLSGEKIIERWTSADTNYKITDLKKGQYTIREAEAPEGYAKAEVVFELNEVGVVSIISGDGKTTEDVDKVIVVVDKKYKPVDLQFKGKKTLEGRELAGDDFEFEITDGDGKQLWTGKNDKDGNIPYPTYTYTFEDIGKEFKYIIKETSKDGNGITVDTKEEYTVTVTVADNGDGTLSVQKAEGSDDPEKLDFVNEYEAKGEIRFKGTKTLKNRKLTSKEYFSFEIKEAESGQTWTVNCDKKGNINYPAITYEKNGEKDDTGTHTYTITETVKENRGITKDKPEKDYTVTVTVTDNGDGTLDVKAAGDDDQKLDFENTYEAKGYITFKGYLHIFYPDPINKMYRKVGKDDVFEFEIVDKDSNKVIAKVKNDATGKIKYPLIRYYLNGEQDDTGRHYYEIREVSKSENGITSDPIPYNVILDVTDNGKGKLVVTVVDDGKEVSENPNELDFYNTYEAKGSITLRSKKVLAGGELAAGDFSVDLIHTDGSVIATAPNGKDGTVYLYRFDLTSTDIELGKQYGIELPYIRTIREHLPEGVDADNPYKDGIIYDTTEHKVAISAKDDGKGKLTLTAVYDDKEDKEDKEDEKYVPTFVNLLTQVKVRKVDSSTQKALKGATLQLLQGKKVIKTWKSDGKGYVLTDLEPGVLYTLHEVAAPSGYTVTSDKTFMLDVDGSYVTNKTTAKIAKDGALVVENTPKKSSSKKTGSGGGSTVGKRGPIVNVETGDDTPIALYVGLLAAAAAAAAAAGIIIFRRRKRK